MLDSNLAMPSQNFKSRYPPQPVGEPIVVSPAFLLKSFAAVIIAALICVYLTLCLLFYQGQWQLIFHPSRTVDRTPASAGLHYEDIHFDATETAHLQLTGWFIPADPGAKYASTTILLCHDNIGSLSNTIDSAAQLHVLGINVFTYDPRGFGKSDWAAPRETRWYEDADAAYRYLTDTRHIPPQSIVAYGIGLGASAAAHIATSNPVAALIAINPVPAGRALVASDIRTRILPMRFLFHEHFLWPNDLKIPTLFIEDKSITCPRPPADFIPAVCLTVNQVHNLFTQSTAPKMYSESPTTNTEFLTRFLDEYLPAN